MAISSTDGSGGTTRPAVSLLFPEGQRPDAGRIHALAAAGGDFAVSFDPGAGPADTADRPGWLELLASGLTFDLVGLVPSDPAPVPSPRQTISLGDNVDARFEAITLQPGPHIAGASGILPIIRSLAWLGAVLSQLEGIEAVCWHPARCWSAPNVYREAVLQWIEGGVFPGLILTSLHAMPDGGLQSEGLDVLTGQELRLEPDLAVDRATGAKLAVRLLDFLVVHGRVESADRVVGPDGTPLRLEPSGNGQFVRVWRG